MSVKRSVQLIVLLVVLLSSLAFSGTASAYTCSTYITVQWGDTLSGIARLCGTTIYAIQAANPGLGSWVYAGQVLYIPTGVSYPPVYYPPSSNGTYVVQRGDTLARIGARIGVSYNDILAINPQIWNPSLIYTGQVINLPAAAPAYHTVQRGETLRIIAGYYGTSVYAIQLLNPQIYDANRIYAGQVIRVK